MKSLMMTDAGGDQWQLSTEHSTSNYGRAVLVGPDGTAYGADDYIDDGWLGRCRDLVAAFRDGDDPPGKCAWGRRTKNAIAMSETIAPSRGNPRYVGPTKLMPFRFPQEFADALRAEADRNEMKMTQYIMHMFDNRSQGQ